MYKDKKKQAEWQRNWHQENKVKRQRRRHDEKRKWLDKIKNGPCIDCGGKFPPAAMHFDHKRGDRKVERVSIVLRTKGYQAAIKEIAKCVLRCANCHAIRTQKQFKNRARIAQRKRQMP